MGLSARTDDNTGLPLGEGYIRLSTSAGNALLFRDPSSAYQYSLNNGAQLNKNNLGGTSPDGDFNDASQAPSES